MKKWNLIKVLFAASFILGLIVFNSTHISAAQDIVEDGTYVIHSVIDESKCVDVTGGSVSEAANVQLWSENDGNAQKFYFARQHNGCYVITAECSGKALTAKEAVSGANAELQDYDGRAEQQWNLMPTGYGTYILQSAAARVYLDICGGFTDDGNNVQVWEYSGSSAQKFTFERVETQHTLGDGTFVIASALDDNMRIDVNRGAYGAGVNVQLWSGNTTNSQKFEVVYEGDGLYTITALCSGMRLDVNGASEMGGANIQQWPANDSTAQRFRIRPVGNGYYCIQAECSGLYLAINGKEAVEGANICQWSEDDSKAQYFKFYETEYEPVVEDGCYTITSQIMSNYRIDIASGSEDWGANVWLWSQNDSNAQKFDIKYVGAGQYKITGACSNLALDVEGGGSANGTNIRQWDDNSSAAQRWYIYRTENGGYYFMSVGSGKMLDVNGAVAYEGNNVQLWEFTGSSAQKFWLDKTNKKYYGWTTINGRKYYYNGNGELHSRLGIDVSKYNGVIDWQAVKNDGIEFAIIRVGYGDDYESQDDIRAIYNMNECERLGIPYGVYLYSYAVCDEQAYSEAAHILRMIKGRNPQMGVFIDIEDTQTYYDAGINPYSEEGRTCITRWTRIILDAVKNAGYTPGVYANYNYYSNILYKDEISDMKWLAYYKTNNPYDNYVLPDGPWVCWQYTSRGSVKGIDGNVDMNAWYRY